MLYEEQKGCKGVHFSMLAIGFVVANSWTVLKPQTFIKLMSPFLIPVLLECGREKLTDVFELSNYATKLFFSPPNKVANLIPHRGQEQIQHLLHIHLLELQHF
jgi:hypothetical protein